jgi:hypothetical protein
MDKVINYDKFDFGNSVVIKPTAQSFDDDKRASKRLTRIVIDSRDRNTDLYPNPASYVIDLDDDIQDVITGELVVADIPFPAYIVNNTNNTIRVSITLDTVIIVADTVISVGDYTPSELAAELTMTLNTNPEFSTRNIAFTVVYFKKTDAFMFTCTSIFALIFKSHPIPFGNDQIVTPYVPNSIGKLLGFGRETYICKSDALNGNFIIAPYRKNFNDSKYTVLQIDQFSLNHSINPIINKSFALIQGRASEMSIYNISDSATLKKVFNPPIARMSKLRITFNALAGGLYDFQNQDHRIELVFESHKQTRGYNSYFAD